MRHAAVSFDNTLKIRYMKELFKLFRDDIKSEGFGKKDLILYGVIMPALLCAFVLLSELINNI